MALTIDDIYDKEFALKGGGYDRNDVDQFLDEICDEMTNMQERISTLEAELQQAKLAAQASAEAVRPMPQPVEKAETAPVGKASETLESILLSAQRLADDAVETAKRRAEDIVKQAEDQASHIVDDAQEEKNTLDKELGALKTAASEYRENFIALLNHHKQMLEDDHPLVQAEYQPRGRLQGAAHQSGCPSCCVYGCRSRRGRQHRAPPQPWLLHAAAKQLQMDGNVREAAGF
ncbi:MAG: DivIVA domain-containing protein [Clostridia bacterium]